jgi:hypothetical protein
VVAKKMPGKFFCTYLKIDWLKLYLPSPSESQSMGYEIANSVDGGRDPLLASLK